MSLENNCSAESILKNEPKSSCKKARVVLKRLKIGDSLLQPVCATSDSTTSLDDCNHGSTSVSTDVAFVSDHDAEAAKLGSDCMKGFAVHTENSEVPSKPKTKITFLDESASADISNSNDVECNIADFSKKKGNKKESTEYKSKDNFSRDTVNSRQEEEMEELDEIVGLCDIEDFDNESEEDHQMDEFVIVDEICNSSRKAGDKSGKKSDANRSLISVHKRLSTSSSSRSKRTTSIIIDNSEDKNKHLTNSKVSYSTKSERSSHRSREISNKYRSERMKKSKTSSRHSKNLSSTEKCTPVTPPMMVEKQFDETEIAVQAEQVRERIYKISKDVQHLQKSDAAIQAIIVYLKDSRPSDKMLERHLSSHQAQMFHKMLKYTCIKNDGIVMVKEKPLLPSSHECNFFLNFHVFMDHCGAGLLFQIAKSFSFLTDVERLVLDVFSSKGCKSHPCSTYADLSLKALLQKDSVKDKNIIKFLSSHFDVSKSKLTEKPILESSRKKVAPLSHRTGKASYNPRENVAANLREEFKEKEVNNASVSTNSALPTKVSNLITKNSTNISRSAQKRQIPVISKNDARMPGKIFKKVVIIGRSFYKPFLMQFSKAQVVILAEEEDISFDRLGDFIVNSEHNSPDTLWLIATGVYSISEEDDRSDLCHLCEEPIVSLRPICTDKLTYEKMVELTGDICHHVEVLVTDIEDKLKPSSVIGLLPSIPLSVVMYRKDVNSHAEMHNEWNESHNHIVDQATFDKLRSFYRIFSEKWLMLSFKLFAQQDVSMDVWKDYLDSKRGLLKQQISLKESFENASVQKKWMKTATYFITNLLNGSQPKEIESKMFACDTFQHIVVMTRSGRVGKIQENERKQDHVTFIDFSFDFLQTDVDAFVQKIQGQFPTPTLVLIFADITEFGFFVRPKQCSKMGCPTHLKKLWPLNSLNGSCRGMNNVVMAQHVITNIERFVAAALRKLEPHSSIIICPMTPTHLIVEPDHSSSDNHAAVHQLLMNAPGVCFGGGYQNDWQQLDSVVKLQWKKMMSRSLQSTELKLKRACKALPEEVKKMCDKLDLSIVQVNDNLSYNFSSNDTYMDQWKLFMQCFIDQFSSQVVLGNNSDLKIRSTAVFASNSTFSKLAKGKQGFENKTGQSAASTKRGIVVSNCEDSSSSSNLSLTFSSNLYQPVPSSLMIDNLVAPSITFSTCLRNQETLGVDSTEGYYQPSNANSNSTPSHYDATSDPIAYSLAPPQTTAVNLNVLKTWQQQEIKSGFPCHSNNRSDINENMNREYISQQPESTMMFPNPCQPFEKKARMEIQLLPKQGSSHSRPENLVQVSVVGNVTCQGNYSSSNTSSALGSGEQERTLTSTESSASGHYAKFNSEVKQPSLELNYLENRWRKVTLSETNKFESQFTDRNMRLFLTKISPMLTDNILDSLLKTCGTVLSLTRCNADSGCDEFCVCTYKSVDEVARAMRVFRKNSILSDLAEFHSFGTIKADKKIDQKTLMIDNLVAIEVDSIILGNKLSSSLPGLDNSDSVSLDDMGNPGHPSMDDRQSSFRHQIFCSGSKQVSYNDLTFADTLSPSHLHVDDKEDSPGNLAFNCTFQKSHLSMLSTEELLTNKRKGSPVFDDPLQHSVSSDFQHSGSPPGSYQSPDDFPFTPKFDLRYRCKGNTSYGKSGILLDSINFLDDKSGLPICEEDIHGCYPAYERSSSPCGISVYRRSKSPNLIIRKQDSSMHRRSRSRSNASSEHVSARSPEQPVRNWHWPEQRRSRSREKSVRSSRYRLDWKNIKSPGQEERSSHSSSYGNRAPTKKYVRERISLFGVLVNHIPNTFSRGAFNRMMEAIGGREATLSSCHVKPVGHAKTDGLLFNFTCKITANAAVQALDKWRFLDGYLRVCLQNEIDMAENVDPEITMTIVDAMKNALTETKSFMTRTLQREMSKDINMFTFKTKKCTIPGCRKKISCHFSHNLVEARRCPKTHAYSALMCANMKPDGSGCPLGDKCTKCHSIFERLYHQKIFRSAICIDWYMHRWCPRLMENRYCCNGHPESPEVLFHVAWKDLYVENLINTLLFAAGALRNMHRLPSITNGISVDVGISVLVVSTNKEILMDILQTLNPLALEFSWKIMLVSDTTKMDNLAGTAMILGTWENCDKLFMSGSSHALLRGVRCVIFDDIVTTFNQDLHQEYLKNLMRSLFRSGVDLAKLNKVAICDILNMEDVTKANELLLTKFLVAGHPNETGESELGQESKGKRSQSPYQLGSEVSSKRQLKECKSTTLAPEQQLKLELETRTIRLQEELESTHKKYIEFPKTHPDFELRFNGFKSLYKQKFPDKDDWGHFQKLWEEFWHKYARETSELQYKSKLEELTKEIEMTRASTARLLSTQLPKNTFSTNIDYLIRQTEHLGSLGVAVKAILKKLASEKEAEQTAILKQSDNALLLNMCVERFHELESSTSGHIMFDHRLSAELIRELLKLKEKQKPYSGIDVQKVARLTVGKEAVAIVTAIKLALSKEGIHNPTMEQVNEIYTVISNVHFRMALGEENPSIPQPKKLPDPSENVTGKDIISSLFARARQTLPEERIVVTQPVVKTTEKTVDLKALLNRYKNSESFDNAAEAYFNFQSPDMAGKLDLVGNVWQIPKDKAKQQEDTAVNTHSLMYNMESNEAFPVKYSGAKADSLQEMFSGNAEQSDWYYPDSMETDMVESENPQVSSNSGIDNQYFGHGYSQAAYGSEHQANTFGPYSSHGKNSQTLPTSIPQKSVNPTVSQPFYDSYAPYSQTCYPQFAQTFPESNPQLAQISYISYPPPCAQPPYGSNPSLPPTYQEK